MHAVAFGLNNNCRRGGTRRKRSFSAAELAKRLQQRRPRLTFRVSQQENRVSDGFTTAENQKRISKQADYECRGTGQGSKNSKLCKALFPVRRM